ncbi:hypothetical protein [Haloplanus rubicundus]|uniref:hypothetical protein n=1 Tax=Haloplanus rubicundus TaxID=1547898 RepID=UPI00130043B8|nr:hypothetical protein [Haloplanus rubicundus]
MTLAVEPDPPPVQRRRIVSLPGAADTDLELENTVLQIASDLEEVSEDAIAVTPESAFVERIVDEAADRTPVGSISLTGENSEIRLPEWITAGPVEVVDRAFTPYYDRRALCVLFHVGIETVSEYQREGPRAIAIDLNDHEERPRLAESYLDLTEVGRQQSFSEETSVDARRVEEAIEFARTAVVDEVDPTVKETQERATRAAEVELDEYRQFVRQRRDELKDEIDNINERIEEVNEAIDSAPTQDERVDALRKRKELSSEVEDLRTELNELIDAILVENFENLLAECAFGLSTKDVPRVGLLQIDLLLTVEGFVKRRRYVEIPYMRSGGLIERCLRLRSENCGISESCEKDISYQ